MILDDVKPRRGGQSVIRKAVDGRSGRAVAVKLVSVGDDSVERRIFRREVETLRGLDHPNIITMIDSGSDESGNKFVVLEWVETSLEQRLETDTGIEWDEALPTFLIPLIEAVAYLHLRGLEHRDLKPGNILLDETGRLIVADFGIGKNHEHDTTTSTVQGFKSGVYAPPELDELIPYVRDVYSIGVVTVRLLGGRPTNPHEVIPALDALTLPDEYKALIRECLSLNPADRPANAAVLSERVASIEHARRSSGLVDSHQVELVFTRKAKELLVGEQGYLDRAGRIATEDLAGAVYISYRWDSESLMRDPTVIFLVGAAIRYTVKLDADPVALQVTGVSRPSYEELEGSRKRGMRIDDLVRISFRALVDRSVPLKGRQFLIEALGAHYDRADSATVAIDASEGALLADVWKRTLDARLELARAENPDLLFTLVAASEKDAEIDLDTVPEQSLVGTEWDYSPDGGAGKKFKCEVIDQQSSRVTVRWRSQRTPTIRRKGKLTAFLGPTQFALQRQHDAVSALASRSSVRSDLIDLLSDPSMIAEAVRVDDPLDHDSLDAPKREALEKALGLLDLMVVNGPPGTGKTRLIAGLIESTLARDRDAKILLVSQTHAAVDNALERTSSETRVVRLAQAGDDRVSPDVRPKLLSNQMQRWSIQVRTRAEQFSEALASSAGLSRTELLAALALQELAVIGREQSHLEEHIAAHESESDGDVTSGVESGVDLAGLHRRLDRIGERFSAKLAEAHGLLAGALTMSTQPDAAEIESAVGAILGSDDSRHLDLLKLQAEWLQRVVSDENLASSLLQSTSVVAGTCLGFMSVKAAREIEFDLCIIDEASKATSTELLVPLSRARTAVLVGDVNQLPPLDEDLLQRTDLLAEFELSREIIRETLFERLADAAPESARVALTRQYRMTKAIGDLISECFYEGALQSDSDHEIAGYSALAKPVLWLDTSAVESRRDSRARNGSFVNRLEAAQVVSRLNGLAQAIDRGLIARRDFPFEVLIIAPYRGQVEELRRRTQGWKHPDVRVAVDSIDAVQGREADFAFLSVVRSNPERRFGFIGRDYWRRINVALSRARYGLVLVGDASFAESEPGALRDVLRYISAHPASCELRPVDA
jgi:hypothetical protein